MLQNESAIAGREYFQEAILLGRITGLHDEGLFQVDLLTCGCLRIQVSSWYGPIPLGCKTDMVVISVRSMVFC
jgi:hypothetical protein